MTRRDLLAAAATAAGCFATENAMNSPASATVTIADRAPDLFGDIYAGADDRRVSARDFARQLAAPANVVFAGEQHDDPLTHRAELRLLQDLHRQVGDRLTLAMEMFERDGQAALDDYLAGRIDEPTMGKRVALWSNYPTDYRPLVEFARTNRIPVAASNAPQRLVRRVGKEGLAAVLPALSPADRALLASEIIVPADGSGDAYARRFAAVIGAGHGDGQGMDAATVQRFLEAQCVRDATMAETVAHLLDAGRFVLHVNGGFHSDAGLGTVQRLLWRRPLATRVAVVKIVPYKGKIDPAPDRPDADYRLYVPDTRPPEKETG